MLFRHIQTRSLLEMIVLTTTVAFYLGPTTISLALCKTLHVGFNLMILLALSWVAIYLQHLLANSSEKDRRFVTYHSPRIYRD